MELDELVEEIDAVYHFIYFRKQLYGKEINDMKRERRALKKELKKKTENFEPVKVEQEEEEPAKVEVE